MKLVIEIPEEAVKTDNITNDFITYFECCTPKLFETLKNGIPLPKHHGDLIERRCGNKLCNGCEHSDICDTYNAPTIIEGVRVNECKTEGKKVKKENKNS